MNIWELIKKYFSRNENWGNPDKVNPTLLMVLYIIRVETGWAISIHEYAYELSGHSDKSQHYKGNACDFHFICNKSLKEQADKIQQILDKFGFTDLVGWGNYPLWHNPGFHLDVRGTKARWGYIGDNKATFEEAIKYGNI